MYQENGKAEDGHFEVQLVASTSSRLHYEVTFPAPRPTGWKEGNTVYGDYFVPRNVAKAPLIVLVPGFGDESIAPCLTLARLLNKQAIATFVLFLPIHSRRLPETMKGGFSPANPHMWLETYESSIREIHQVANWASMRQEIDPDRIAVTGFSLGGMISSIAMAKERRISAGIFIVIGGNMEELSWGGVTDALPIGHTCTQEECHAVYSRYPAFLSEVKERGLEKVVPAKECFLFDPLTFAGQLRGRPVLMINAREDDIVPEHATLNLWAAYGRPKLVWLPGNHADAYSHSAFISSEIARFLNNIKA